jgi:hypothetical protein
MPSTKQLRVTDPLQIKNRIKEFLGKKINVVLTDNRVIIGELKEVKSSGITLINMRLKKMEYSFDQLAEVYFDGLV